MRAYFLTPRARDGLLGIVAFVEERFGAPVADRVLGEIEAAFELLARHPDLGHRREDLTADERLRFWSVGPTLIAYRNVETHVEVLFVERGAVDWERVLDERLR